MPCTEFETWNPILQVKVNQGAVLASELLTRTIRFVMVDRIKEYDHIEWEVLNHDGLFTQPATMAAGMVVSIRLGYADGTTPWKTFIINRMRGGVGVTGTQNSPMGEGDETLILYGRNRNAPGGRDHNSGWAVRKRGAPPRPHPGKDKTAKGKVRKPRPIYGPTADMRQMDMLLNGDNNTSGKKGKPISIKAKTTSEAVRKLLVSRHGFKADQIIIEPTGDWIEKFVVPAGRSLIEHMRFLGDSWGYDLWFDLYGTIHWHTTGWKGDWRTAESDVEAFRYGGGPDILRIGIDADFELPFANDMKASAAGKTKRIVYAQNVPMDTANKKFDLGTMVVDMGLGGGSYGTAQGMNLVRAYKLPHLPVDSSPQVLETIKRKYIDQLTKGFQLSVNAVGNPKLMAGGYVSILGSGSIFMDGTWLIGECRHVFQNSDSIVYGTDLKLLATPRQRGKWRGKKPLIYTKNRLDDQTNKTNKTGSMTVSGYTPEPLPQSKNVYKAKAPGGQAPTGSSTK